MKMKLNGLFFILLTFFMICFTTLPAFASKIATLSASDSYITVGDSFTVDVSVYDDGTLGDLTGFGFDVDPLNALSFLTFTGYYIDSASFTDFGPGNSVSGAWAPFDEPLFNTGTNVLLAELSFFAGPSSGDDSIVISGIFDGLFSGLFYENGGSDTGYDLDGDPVYGESIYGSLNITVHDAVQPIPEPATMLLLGTGLLGVGIAGRRKMKK